MKTGYSFCFIYRVARRGYHSQINIKAVFSNWCLGTSRLMIVTYIRYPLPLKESYYIKAGLILIDGELFIFLGEL